jgi:hypothetical protein
VRTRRTSPTAAATDGYAPDFVACFLYFAEAEILDCGGISAFNIYL